MRCVFIHDTVFIFYLKTVALPYRLSLLVDLLHPEIKLSEMTVDD